jgi:hypothetical protein
MCTTLIVIVSRYIHMYQRNLSVLKQPTEKGTSHVYAPCCICHSKTCQHRREKVTSHVYAPCCQCRSTYAFYCYCEQIHSQVPKEFICAETTYAEGYLARVRPLLPVPMHQQRRPKGGTQCMQCTCICYRNGCIATIHVVLASIVSLLRAA